MYQLVKFPPQLSNFRLAKMLPIKVLLILFTIEFVYFPIANAQNDPFPKWENYTNGKNITAVEQHGNSLWIGTVGGGLIKMNTKTKDKVFYNSANSGLPCNVIQSLAIDDTGTKWIGTKKHGLVKFDNNNWTMYNEDNSIVGNYVESIAIDSTGILWVGNAHNAGGLNRYDGQNWTVYDIYNSPLPHNWVVSIVVDSSNNKWIGTSQGLVRLKNDQWTVYTESNSEIPDNNVQSIAIDDSNGIWVALGMEGIFQYHNGNWNTHLYDPFRNFNTIKVSPMGNVWISTWEEGVAKYDGSTWSYYTQSNTGLNWEQVADIAFDNQGNTWMGTKREGLIQFDSINWNIDQLSNSQMPHSHIQEIAIDDSGTLWMGAGDIGLITFDGNNWNVLDGSKANITGGFRVLSITIDNQGNIWVGTQYKGLLKYNGSKWKVFNSSNTPISLSGIRAITIDSNDTKWLAAYAGIVKYDNHNWTLFDFMNTEIPYYYSNFSSIVIDTAGNKWVGTLSDGLIKYDGSNWTFYKESNSGLPDDDIFSLAVDDSNNIWIGTGGGLGIYQDSIRHAYDFIYPGYDPAIKNIVIDRSTGLHWIATSRFLTKFRNCKYYTYDIYNSGLPYRHVSDVAIDPDNNVWTGSIGGLTVLKESMPCPSTVSHIVVVSDSTYTSPSCEYKSNTSGAITDTIFNNRGCDSIISITFFVSSSEDTVAACKEYTWPKNGITYDSSGFYWDTIENIVGKDTIVGLNLVIKEPTEDTLSITACKSYMVPSGDTTYFDSGKYLDTIQKSEGCDSIITINLTVVHPTTDTIKTAACDSILSPSGNRYWKDSGWHLDTISNTQGCDSIIFVNLTINKTTSSTINPMTCDSFTVPSNHETYTVSGTYFDTITNSNECDSIITINLTVVESNFVIENINTCDSFKWSANNQVYSTTGIYDDTLKNKWGCDSIITLVLDIITIDTSIVKSGNLLTSNADSASLQWLDCNNNYRTIKGATGQSFKVSKSGSYAVKIEKDGCADTSSCYQFNQVGILENDFGLSCEFYPNPTPGKLKIEMDKRYGRIEVIIRNVQGQIIHKKRLEGKKKLDMELTGAKGFYLIELATSNNKSAVIQILKQ